MRQTPSASLHSLEARDRRLARAAGISDRRLTWLRKDAARRRRRVFPSAPWKDATKGRHYVTPKVAEAYKEHGIPLERDERGTYIASGFDLNELAGIVGKGTLQKAGRNSASDLIVCTQDPATGGLDKILALGRKHGGSIASRSASRGPSRVTLTTPGGRLDEGEDSVTAALREFGEEVFGHRDGAEKLAEVLGCSLEDLKEQLTLVYRGEAHDPRNTSSPELEADPENPRGAWMYADVYALVLTRQQMQHLIEEIPRGAVVGDAKTYSVENPETRCVAVLSWRKIRRRGRSSLAQLVQDDPQMRHLVPLLESQDPGCTQLPPDFYTRSHGKFYAIIDDWLRSGSIRRPYSPRRASKKPTTRVPNARARAQRLPTKRTSGSPSL